MQSNYIHIGGVSSRLGNQISQQAPVPYPDTSKIPRLNAMTLFAFRVIYYFLTPHSRTMTSLQLSQIASRTRQPQREEELAQPNPSPSETDPILWSRFLHPFKQTIWPWTLHHSHLRSGLVSVAIHQALANKCINRTSMMLGAKTNSREPTYGDRVLTASSKYSQEQIILKLQIKQQEAFPPPLKLLTKMITISMIGVPKVRSLAKTRKKTLR